MNPDSTLGLSDKALMIRFTERGDEGAFETLVRRWDARVLSFLTKASRDAEAAKDLRQEVFIRVYRYANTYKHEFAFSTWLFQIAGNALATWHAKESRGLRLLWSSGDEAREMRVVDPGPGPLELAALDELNGHIEDAMHDFTLVDRQLILLRLELEMSYPEIANVMNTPETTLKSRFYTLMKRLRNAISVAERSEERSTCK